MPATPREPRLVLTAGEPAGIGPDVCLAVARDPWPAHVTVLGDLDVLAARQCQLGLDVTLQDVGAPDEAPVHRPGTLHVWHHATARPVTPGRLDPGNARHVLTLIERAAGACLAGAADAVVTAPVHKGVINDAGVAFTGHTEYLAQLCGGPHPVMLLCAGTLRVALATTHLPLRAVADALDADSLEAVLRIVHADLGRVFGIDAPAIAVCGLNPHAGEGGHLGDEELRVLIPVLDRLRGAGLDLRGPLPADTAFTPRVLDTVDAVVAMYHDQGLPVLKYAGFGEAVNVTLGLPILRTSVDHGTALDLAGRGTADAGSLRAAMAMAIELAASR